MSADTVDDLHSAEDLAGFLASALRRMAEAEADGPDADAYAEAATQARAALAAFDAYCRPTCDEPVTDPGDCGCPCHGRTESR